MRAHLFKLQRKSVVEKLTPDVVLEALDPNNATIKYGVELVKDTGAGWRISDAERVARGATP